MSQSKDELLSFFLKELQNEPNISRNQLRTCLETLITVYKNLLKTNDLKFRKIKVNNKSFYDKVWKFESAKNFLLSSGWVEDTEKEDNEFHDVILFGESSCVSNCLKLLIDNRDVKPDSNDWTDKNKVLVVNQNKFQEQELRRKANIERINQMKDFERQKREKELLAENIKKEIESDNKHRQKLRNNSNDENDSLVQSFSKLNTLS